MASTLVNPPAVVPITVAEAKAHLRITHDEEDSFIEALIAAATRFMADNDGICAIRQTWRYYVSDTATAHQIYRYPVIGINKSIGFNSNGNASTLPLEAVELDSRKRPAELCFDQILIGAAAENGAEIDIDVGFGETPLDLPDTLKSALIILVAHWYTFRAEVAPKDQPVSVPEQYSRLVASFRMIGLGA